jgi:hypothetical protein
VLSVRWEKRFLGAEKNGEKKSRILPYSINITALWGRVKWLDIYFASSSAIAFSILIFKSTAVRIED